MSKEKDPRRIVTSPVRLAFPKLAVPELDEDKGTKSYKTKILFPLKDKALLKAVIKCEQAAAIKKWGKEKAAKLFKHPKFKRPMRDPIAEDMDGAEYEGMHFLNANTQERFGAPGVILRDGEKLIGEAAINEHIYSGVWARMSLTFIGFEDEKGGKGICVAIKNCMKWDDGERLDGSASAEEDFADLIDDDFSMGDDDGLSEETAESGDDDWDLD